MKHARTAILLATLILVSCADQASSPTNTGAAAFFKTLSADEYVLDTEVQPADESEAIAIDWLCSTLPTVISDPDAEFSFVVSAKRPGDDGAYALDQHAAHGFPALAPGKTYVQVQCKPRDLASPEFHGVIDPTGPTLLSFFSEGG